MSETLENKESSSEPEKDAVPEIKNNKDLLLYFFVQIKRHRKWWLLPLLAVLAFLALFVSLTGNSSILPAIYALF